MAEKTSSKKQETFKKTGGAKASAKNASPKKEVVKKETTKKVEATPVKKAPKKEVRVKVKEVSKADLMASLDDEKEVAIAKEENKKEWKEILLKIWDIVFWILFIAIALTWVTDYFRVRSDKEPQFCLSTKTHEFEDGTVEQCTGIGYKVYTYNRQSLDTGVEFVPFFVKMQQPSTTDNK